jgi:hypothetical protein
MRNKDRLRTKERKAIQEAWKNMGRSPDEVMAGISRVNQAKKDMPKDKDEVRAKKEKQRMIIMIMVVFLLTVSLILVMQRKGEDTGESNEKGSGVMPTAMVKAAIDSLAGELGEYDDQLSDLHPDRIQQWEEIIEECSREAGIDPDLMGALIDMESGGDPLAYSSSGAVGLGQVMPKDGIAAGFECINGPCFASRPSIKELQDPKTNVCFSANMLAGQIRKNGLERGLMNYGPADEQVARKYAENIKSLYRRRR